MGVSLRSPGWPELKIFLVHSPECYDYRCVSTHMLICSLFYFLWCWCFELRVSCLLGRHATAWAMLSSLNGSLYFIYFCGLGVWTQSLHLETLHQPFFVKGFSRQDLSNYLPRLASNCCPPDLCLLSS
jgi:hypothetical protein